MNAEIRGDTTLSVIKTRGYQLFPVLDGNQIDTAKRFASGPEQEFAPGEIVYNVGERDVPNSRAQSLWYVAMASITKRQSPPSAPDNSLAR
jgi:hypothetical protein